MSFITCTIVVLSIIKNNHPRNAIALPEDLEGKFKNFARNTVGHGIVPPDVPMVPMSIAQPAAPHIPLTVSQPVIVSTPQPRTSMGLNTVFAGSHQHNTVPVTTDVIETLLQNSNYRSRRQDDRHYESVEQYLTVLGGQNSYTTLRQFFKAIEEFERNENRRIQLVTLKCKGLAKRVLTSYRLAHVDYTYNDIKAYLRKVLSPMESCNSAMIRWQGIPIRQGETVLKFALRVEEMVEA